MALRATKMHENQRDKNFPPIDRRGFLTPQEGIFRINLMSLCGLKKAINKIPDNGKGRDGFQAEEKWKLTAEATKIE